MANNFDSNITQKLLRVFTEQFMTKLVFTNNVNTSMIKGQFNASTGDTINVKRPTDYVTKRTSDGDISATTATPIITGKASVTVQDYFTEEVDWQEADQAIKMDQLDELLDPITTRMAIDHELDFATFMLKNSGTLSGDPGNNIDSWLEIAQAGAMAEALGWPKDGKWCMAINPHTQVNLAEIQRSLGAGPDGLVKEAHEQAVIAKNFAGLKVMTSNCLSSYTSHSGADRAGTLSANPTVTYLGAKDTFTQTLSVTGFQANLEVRAGEIIQITGRNRLNLSTRQAIVDATGANVLFTGVVTTAVTLGASGEGDIVVTGPAIFESGGAYNTVDSAPVSGDVVTLLGSASELRQPSLVWHPNAFALAYVQMEKLYSTDTIYENEQGMSIRCSKGASIRENKQIVRFDLRPAYGALNQFLAMQAFGNA